MECPPASSQRDSSAAPSPAFEVTPLRLSLTPQEEASFTAEVERLQVVSAICRIVGTRPSRGNVRDILQARLLADVGRITVVQILGHGFYQVEFADAQSVATVLAMSPLAIQGACAFFMPWYHGFDPATEASKERLIPMTVCFLGLHREYLPLLPRIGALFGSLLETSPLIASMVACVAGLPLVKVLVQDPSALSDSVLLPMVGEGFLTQRVEYSGLPNQCFICRQLGHLAKMCPRQRSRPITQQPQPQQQQQQQPPLVKAAQAGGALSLTQ